MDRSSDYASFGPSIRSYRRIQTHFSPLNIKILRFATFINIFFVKNSSQIKDRPPITYTQWIRTDLLYRIKVLLQSLDFSRFHFQTFKSSNILFQKPSLGVGIAAGAFFFTPKGTFKFQKPSLGVGIAAGAFLFHPKKTLFEYIRIYSKISLSTL